MKWKKEKLGKNEKKTEQAKNFLKKLKSEK